MALTVPHLIKTKSCNQGNIQQLGRNMRLLERFNLKM